MIMFYDKFIFKNYKKLYKYIKKINFNPFFTIMNKINSKKIEWYPNHLLIHFNKNDFLKFNIYYIRTQKRYNKMKYVRTKRYSRVAFFVSLLALILFGQRLEWLFYLPSTYVFKIK